jgi:hypothetical protein
MTARKPTDVVQVNLRLRESLRRKLEHEAERRGCSFNAELTRRLEESFVRGDLYETLRSAFAQLFTQKEIAAALQDGFVMALANVADASKSELGGDEVAGLATLGRALQAARERKTRPENKS